MSGRQSDRVLAPRCTQVDPAVDGRGHGNPRVLRSFAGREEERDHIGILLTMAAVLNAGVLDALTAVGTFELANLLHAAQSVELLRPLPAAGTVRCVWRIADMFDKGSAAVVVLENTATDPSDDAECFRVRNTL